MDGMIRECEADADLGAEEIEDSRLATQQRPEHKSSHSSHAAPQAGPCVPTGEVQGLRCGLSSEEIEDSRGCPDLAPGGCKSNSNKTPMLSCRHVAETIEAESWAGCIPGCTMTRSPDSPISDTHSLQPTSGFGRGTSPSHFPGLNTSLLDSASQHVAEEVSEVVEEDREVAAQVCASVPADLGFENKKLDSASKLAAGVIEAMSVQNCSSALPGVAGLGTLVLRPLVLGSCSATARIVEETNEVRAQNGAGALNGIACLEPSPPHPAGLDLSNTVAEQGSDKAANRSNTQLVAGPSSGLESLQPESLLKSKTLHFGGACPEKDFNLKACPHISAALGNEEGQARYSRERGSSCRDRLKISEPNVLNRNTLELGGKSSGEEMTVEAAMHALAAHDIEGVVARCSSEPGPSFGGTPEMLQHNVANNTDLDLHGIGQDVLDLNAHPIRHCIDPSSQGGVGASPPPTIPSSPVLDSSPPPTVPARGSHFLRLGSQSETEERCGSEVMQDSDEFAIHPATQRYVDQEVNLGDVWLEETQEASTQPATQQYANCPTVEMPPPPPPRGSRKQSALGSLHVGVAATREDVETQQYLDLLCGLPRPHKQRKIDGEQVLSMSGDVEDAETLHCTGVAHQCCRMAPSAGDGSGYKQTQEIEELATQQYSAILRPCVVVPVSESPSTEQPSLDIGQGLVPGHDEIAPTRDHGSFSFSGSICIVPDDHSDHDIGAGAPNRFSSCQLGHPVVTDDGLAQILGRGQVLEHDCRLTSSALGAAPKWAARPPLQSPLGGFGQIKRKRPAQVVASESGFKSAAEAASSSSSMRLQTRRADEPACPSVTPQQRHLENRCDKNITSLQLDVSPKRKLRGKHPCLKAKQAIAGCPGPPSPRLLTLLKVPSQEGRGTGRGRGRVRGRGRCGLAAKALAEASAIIRPALDAEAEDDVMWLGEACLSDWPQMAQMGQGRRGLEH